MNVQILVRAAMNAAFKMANAKAMISLVTEKPEHKVLPQHLTFGIKGRHVSSTADSQGQNHICICRRVCVRALLPHITSWSCWILIGKE